MKRNCIKFATFLLLVVVLSGCSNNASAEKAIKEYYSLADFGNEKALRNHIEKVSVYVFKNYWEDPDDDDLEYIQYEIQEAKSLIESAGRNASLKKVNKSKLDNEIIREIDNELGFNTEWDLYIHMQNEEPLVLYILLKEKSKLSVLAAEPVYGETLEDIFTY